MLLGLGIPVWWFTTAVHRANLPELKSLDFSLDHQKMYITYKSANDPHVISEKLKQLENVVLEKCKFICVLFFISKFLIIFIVFCHIVIVHEKLNEKETNILKFGNSIESIDIQLRENRTGSTGLVIMEVAEDFLMPWEAVFGDYNHIYISPETCIKTQIITYDI